MFSDIYSALNGGILYFDAPSSKVTITLTDSYFKSIYANHNGAILIVNILSKC